MLLESEFCVQILDDDAKVTDALALAFELNTPFPTITANRPESGLKQLAERRIHFQIVDYKMPHLDGLAYLREAKKLVPTAIRTLLTGQAGLENVIQLVNEVGLHYYFTKPVDNQQIIQVVQRAYESERLRLENDAIKQTFQSYLPPEILQGVLQRKDELMRGGSYELTVLFTDIRGFTRYSEHADPVGLLRDLNRYLEYMCEEVLRHGGLVDKFIGDSVMAVFGGPLAPPDSSREMRAVSCALNMIEVQRKYNAMRVREGMSPPLEIGIGIASGRATLGNIGYPKKYDFTAIGRTVNRAAKLVKGAPPTGIWIDQTTFERIDAETRARCTQLSPEQLRDIPADLTTHVYQVAPRT